MHRGHPRPAGGQGGAATGLLRLPLERDDVAVVQPCRAGFVADRPGRAGREGGALTMVLYPAAILVGREIKARLAA
jgi:hypothetical protein